jgi:hypothetical protein
MSHAESPIACNLGALTGDERDRRRSLAERVTVSFREVRETPDGYAARLDPDPEIAHDALTWVLLERRCCPFLHMGLRFETDDTVWLYFGGGAGVKEFLAAAGFNVTDRTTRCGC